MHYEYLEARIQVPIGLDLVSDPTSDLIQIQSRIPIYFDISATIRSDPMTTADLIQVQELIIQTMKDYYLWESLIYPRFQGDSDTEGMLIDSEIITVRILEKLDGVSDLSLRISLVSCRRTIPIRCTEIDPMTGLRIDYVLDTSVIYQRADGEDEGDIITPQDVRVLSHACRKYCSSLSSPTRLWSDYRDRTSLHSDRVVETGYYDQYVLNETVRSGEYHLLAFDVRLRNHSQIFEEMKKARQLVSPLSPWVVLLLTITIGPVITYLMSQYLTDRLDRLRGLPLEFWLMGLMSWSLILGLIILLRTYTLIEWFDSHDLLYMVGPLGNLVVNHTSHIPKY